MNRTVARSMLTGSHHLSDPIISSTLYVHRVSFDALLVARSMFTGVSSDPIISSTLYAHRVSHHLSDPIISSTLYVHRVSSDHSC